MLVDLHTHTRFFHGFQARATSFDPIGAQLLKLSGWWHDLDAVALTNHDYYAAFETIGNTPHMIPGIEITTTAGHVLVIGPDPPAQTIPGNLSPTNVVSLAHERGCVAIIAHPFRRSRIRECGANFDAVEVNGKHTDDFGRVKKLAETLDLPVVGGSDAHFPFETGRVFTKMDTPNLTPEAIVTAIKERDVEPRIRETPVDTVMKTAYRYVHEYL